MMIELIFTKTFNSDQLDKVGYYVPKAKPQWRRGLNSNPQF